MKNRFQFWRSCGLGWVVLSSLGACGETEVGFGDVPSAGSAGSSGTGGWTSLPSAGSSAGGKVGTAGSSSTGGGAQGGSSAGKSGSGGMGGTAQPPVTFGCNGKVPNQAVITSFNGFTGDRWQSPGNLDGGVYVYPEPLMLAAGEFLGFDDEIDDYTGIGAWFNGCIDASQFEGVRLTVSGSVGVSGTVQFYLVSNRDRVVDEANSVGACVPADANDTWQSCRPPVVTLAVTGTPTTHDIPWAAFKGGLPTAGSDGSDLLALQWSFNWVEPNSAVYDAKLVIDDLQFLVDGGGSAGQGGGGGTASAGTGGAADAGGDSAGGAAP